MKTIQDMWTQFAKAVINSNAPPVQLTEMRMAFFAGFQSCLTACDEIAAIDDEEICVNEIKKLHQQCQKFAEMYTGRPTAEDTPFAMKG